MQPLPVMKKYLLLCTAALLASHAADAQVLAWEQKADFPGDGRSAVVSFSFMDKGFIGAGYDGEDYRRSFYMYDPVTDAWTQTESLGGIVGEGMERNCAASFTIGNKGYVGTGQGGDPFLKDVWEYNKTNNTWVLRGNVADIDRRCAVGFSINDKGYIGLGQDATGYRKDLWEMDTTTGAWTQKADFIGTPRRLSASFVIGGLAYVGTGDDGAFTNDFYVYDPNLNIWNARADFIGSPRYSATGFALNGIGYFTCGYDTTFTNRSDFYSYDPIADVWTQLPDFPGGSRSNAAAFVVDTLAFIGMGYDTSFYYDIWMWGDTTDPKPIDTTIAISDPFGSSPSIQVAPNPAYTYTVLSVALEAAGQVDVLVFDMQGRNVTDLCSITHNAAPEQWQLTIGTDRLQAGTYHCVVVQDDMRATAKFVVIK